MVIYGKIAFDVLADEEEINGPNEIVLSDRFGELETMLENWLANEMGTEFPEFDFSIRFIE